MTNRNLKRLLTMAIAVVVSATASASAVKQTKGDFEDKFRQMEEILPTPNVYRAATGEPGEQYWQQKVDYKIQVKLNEEKRRLDATQTITYKNNSPYTLKFLWLQLEQNKYKPDSIAEAGTAFAGIGRRGPATSAGNGNKPAKLSLGELRRQQFLADNELGYDVLHVKSENGRPLRATVVGTNLRVDLASPLKPGKSVTFKMDFGFNIVEENAVSARAGYEHFPDDARKGGNDIFLLAQWFPRLHAFTDYEGWHNKEFIGRGEFTLEFGDYEVEITVPADHIVSSTGVLDNPSDVLTKTQRHRLEKARTATRPVFIVTEEEALENEKE